MHEAVVAADPHHRGGARRRCEVDDRVVKFGAGYVGVDGSARDLQVCRFVSGEVGTYRAPMRATVVRLEHDIAAEEGEAGAQWRERERRFPVEAVPHARKRTAVRVRHLGRNIDIFARGAGEDAELPIDRRDADVPDGIGPAGLRPGPRAVAVIADVAPSLGPDTVRGEAVRRPAKRIVILQAAAYVVRRAIVEADVVRLRDRQVCAPIPCGPAVERDRRAAVVRVDHALAVACDPQAVVVLMDGSPQLAIGPTAVSGLDEVFTREKHVVAIGRVHVDARMIERPLIQ